MYQRRAKIPRAYIMAVPSPSPDLVSLLSLTERKKCGGLSDDSAVEFGSDLRAVLSRRKLEPTYANAWSHLERGARKKKPMEGTPLF